MMCDVLSATARHPRGVGGVWRTLSSCNHRRLTQNNREPAPPTSLSCTTLRSQLAIIPLDACHNNIRQTCNTTGSKEVNKAVGHNFFSHIILPKKYASCTFTYLAAVIPTKQHLSVWSLDARHFRPDNLDTQASNVAHVPLQNNICELHMCTDLHTVHTRSSSTQSATSVFMRSCRTTRMHNSVMLYRIPVWRTCFILQSNNDNRRRKFLQFDQ